MSGAKVSLLHPAATAIYANAGSHVKGSVIRAHLQWVRDHFGERAMTRILSILPARAAVEVEAALPSMWCSFESVVLLDRAIETICGAATTSTARAAGRYTAHIELLAVNGESLRGELHHAGRFVARRYRELHDFAEYRYVESSDSSGRLVVSNASASSRAYCTATIGFCEQTLLMLLEDIPLLNESSCRCDGATLCVFEIQIGPR